jgi:hypothetical protein
MKNQQPRRIRPTTCIMLAGSLVAAGLVVAGPSPHMYGGPFGLARDQTVRVSVASMDNMKKASNMNKDSSCRFEVHVLDADGSVIVQTKPFGVKQGGSFSQDLRFGDLGRGGIDPANPNRAQLRIASFASTADGRACPSDSSVKMTVEVFDEPSGRTSFMVPTDSFLPAVQ